MIYTIGLSRAEQAALDEAHLKEQPWVKHFAWTPVWLSDNKWAWMQMVEKQDEYKYEWKGYSTYIKHVVLVTPRYRELPPRPAAGNGAAGW